MRNLFKICIPVYIISVILFSFFYTDKDQNRRNNQLQQEAIPLTISVYRTQSCTVDTVPFETYVACVVASEVPGSFHMEALKAQAVAARTYAAARLSASLISGCPTAHPLAPVCDSSHCQVYYDVDTVKRKTGWDKIEKAVHETESQVLYYDGKLVMHALFHASSGGKTENSEDVFVSAVPYLKSVDSPYESSYQRNGHGVGMSQQGANGMACAGYSYKEILSHYYTGTTVH